MVQSALATGRWAGFLAAAALAVLGLFWASALNGQAFFYPDSTTYVHAADKGVNAVLGVRTAWTETAAAVAGERAAGQAGAEAALAEPVASDAETVDTVVLKGRSIYYGILLYLGVLAGSFWFVLAVQGLAVGLTLYAMFHTRFDRPLLRTLVVVGTLGLTTPLSFFVGFLMPDIWTPVAILALVLLLLDWKVLSWTWRGILVALLTYGALAHDTVLPIALAIGVVAGIASMIRPDWSPGLLRRSALTLGGAALVQLTGSFMFDVMVEKKMGHTPIRPPFLTARLIADGPGLEFLRQQCPDSGFLICAYRDRLVIPPKDDPYGPYILTDQILWDPRPGVGVFEPANLATKQKLGEEQFAFALAVIMEDPLGVKFSVLHNWLSQAVYFYLSDFRYDDRMKTRLVERLPEADHAQAQQSMAYRGATPTVLMSGLSYAALWLSVAFMVGLTLRGRRIVNQIPQTTILFVVFVTVGVIANALICGAVSGPYPRFQARVVWLIPLIAMVLSFTAYPAFWGRILSWLAPPAFRMPAALAARTGEGASPDAFPMPQRAGRSIP